MEEKNKIRPLTPEEEKQKKTMTMAMLAFVLLGALVAAYVMFTSGNL